MISQRQQRMQKEPACKVTTLHPCIRPLSFYSFQMWAKHSLALPCLFLETMTLLRMVSKGQQTKRAPTRLPQESMTFLTSLAMACLQESQMPKYTPLAADMQTRLMRMPLKMPLMPFWCMASLMHLSMPKSGCDLISLERITLKQSNGQMEIWMARPARLPMAPLTITKCFWSCWRRRLSGEEECRKRVRQRWMSSFTVKTPMLEGKVLSRKKCTPLKRPKNPYSLTTLWKVLVTVEQGRVMDFLTMSSGLICSLVLTSSMGLERAMAAATMPMYLRYLSTSI